MPDGRPKPLELIEGHRTKAEKAARATGQKKLSTTEKMKAPKGAAKNKVACAHWRRLTSLLSSVGMDEAFYERAIWRYCLILAEHEQLAEERTARAEDLEGLRGKQGEMDVISYYKMLEVLIQALDAVDRAVAKKRDQLLAIEKENLMTVQGKLRAVPKKPTEKKLSGIEAYRQARNG